MKGREIPPAVGLGVVLVSVLVVVYILWSRTGPSMATGGKPTARDLELLKQMNEARERAGIGRRPPVSSQEPAGPSQQPTGSR